MELTRLAALTVLIGGVVLSVAVGLWDWRAGLACFGVLLIAGGLASLRSASG